jgi:serine/threonine-protein kinase PknG
VTADEQAPRPAIAVPTPTAMTRAIGPATGERARHEPAPTIVAGPDASGGDSGAGRTSGRGTGGLTGRATSRLRLAAGLVEVPRSPGRDPSQAIMPNPEVAENKRFCGRCGAPVGRSGETAQAHAEGECPSCGTRFSFRPRLAPGARVGGQYEVLGCLTYGGVGWIYLATDHNVSDRWVVLKGLINSADASAASSAVAEQVFLAEVEHPNIVKIYNFVQHPDPDTGDPVGYIVMEYVGGESLRRLALSNVTEAGRVQPLPLAEVLAYGLEILPALGYFHSLGLLYCDLKPDNVIRTEDALKLIDLGAVLRVDDMVNPIFFTGGYAAPELAGEGPSVASDLYTVGRMLAVLSFDFTGFTSTYQYSVPPRDEVPVFARFESFHRLVLRATERHPGYRFASAEEMSDQLAGVLREVVAANTGEQRPARSTRFGPELRTFGSEMVAADGQTGYSRPPELTEVIDALPAPLADPQDPAADLIATVSLADPELMLERLGKAPETSAEAPLWRARARIALGDIGGAGRALDEAVPGDTASSGVSDWRLGWFRGLLALAARRPREAYVGFESVYGMLPGEIAPKLALAAAAEYGGDYVGAARFYELVWRTDRNYVSAAFGLARSYLAQDDRAGALGVLDSVPDRSVHHVAAQSAAITIRAATPPEGGLAESELFVAGQALQALRVEPQRRHQLAVQVLSAGLEHVLARKASARQNGGSPAAEDGSSRLLGAGLSERELRTGLERSYRALARLAGGSTERIALVDKANSVRPRTLT